MAELMNPRQQLRQRSLQSLAHPISIGAIVLLLINDHWLRWHHPSWWSGKIGGFTWLIFAPFLVVILLSYIWPKQKIYQVGSAAFIGTGLIYALGNSVPIFHHLIVWLFQQIAGWQPMMILDPTDLLMLPGLIVGWKIWQASSPRFEQAVLTLRKQMLGCILLTIGAISTIANQPSFPDYGVYCVARHEQTVLGVTVWEAGWFESEDGGLTWTQFDDYQSFPESPCTHETLPWILTDPTNTNNLWRIGESGEFVELSRDGGNSWQTVYDLPSSGQVREYYYRPEPNFLGRRDIRPGGPYNSVVDPATGNLIVSMGFEGVIVITPAGEVNRVAVGPYSFVDIAEISLAEILNKELVLALILGFLGISIASIPLWAGSRGRTMFLVVLSLGTAVWLICTLFFREAGILTLVSLGLFSIWGLFFYAILAGIAVQKIIENGSWQLAGQLLAAAMITALIFLIPLVFWATGKVPSYQLVIVLSIVLAVLPIRYSYNLVSNTLLLERQN